MILDDRESVAGSVVVQILSMSVGITFSLVLALLGCAFWDKHVTGRKPHDDLPDESRTTYSIKERQLRPSTNVNPELTSMSQRQSLARSANKQPESHDTSPPPGMSPRHEVISPTEIHDSYAIYSELDSTYSRLDEVDGLSHHMPTLISSSSNPMLPPRTVTETGDNCEKRKSVFDPSLHPGGSYLGGLPIDAENPPEPGYSAIRIPAPRHSRNSTTLDNDSTYTTKPGDVMSSVVNGGAAVSDEPGQREDDNPKYSVVNKPKKTSEVANRESEDFSHLYSPIIKPNKNQTPYFPTSRDSQISVQSHLPTGSAEEFGYSSIAELGGPPTQSINAGTSRLNVGEVQRSQKSRMVTTNIYEDLDDVRRHDN